MEQENGFHFSASYWQNYLGLGEKWFKDKSGAWFTLTPGGALSQAGGNLVAMLDPLVWDNPDVLFTAALPGAAQAKLGQLRDQYGFRFGGSYYENYLGLGEKWLLDHAGNWYVITPDGNVSQWNGDSSLTQIASVDPSVAADPQLLFQAPVTMAQGSLTQLGQVEQAGGYHFAGSYYQNWLGHNEKWLQDQNGSWFFIDTAGTLWQWQGGTALNSTMVALFDPLVWDDPNLLFGA